MSLRFKPCEIVGLLCDVGQLTADNHKFLVEVADNRMDVRFIPRAGSKLPVINALRVTQ